MLGEVVAQGLETWADKEGLKYGGCDPEAKETVAQFANNIKT